MNCRYCDERLEKNFSYGSVPMTPNAVEEGVLLKNGKPIEYELAISVCKKCGLIQQFNSPDPSVLYFIFKNEIVGDIWEKHYFEFSDFIAYQKFDGVKILNNLIREKVKLCSPSIIVCFGERISQFALDSNDSILSLRNNFFNLFNSKLICTLALNSILDNQSKKRLVWEDIKKVNKEVLDEK